MIFRLFCFIFCFILKKFTLQINLAKKSIFTVRHLVGVKNRFYFFLKMRVKICGARDSNSRPVPSRIRCLIIEPENSKNIPGQPFGFSPTKDIYLNPYDYFDCYQKTERWDCPATDMDDLRMSIYTSK